MYVSTFLSNIFCTLLLCLRTCEAEPGWTLVGWLPGLLCQTDKHHRGLRNVFGSWTKYFLSLKSLEGHGDKNLSAYNSYLFSLQSPTLVPSANNLQLQTRLELLMLYIRKMKIFWLFYISWVRHFVSFHVLPTFIIGHHLLGVSCGFDVACVRKELPLPVAFVLHHGFPIFK